MLIAVVIFFPPIGEINRATPLVVLKDVDHVSLDVNASSYIRSRVLGILSGWEKNRFVYCPRCDRISNVEWDLPWTLPRLAPRPTGWAGRSFVFDGVNQALLSLERCW